MPTVKSNPGQATHYYRYTTREHCRLAVEGCMVAFYAVNDLNEFIGSVETYPDGVSLVYDLKNPVDANGMLPVGEMDIGAASEMGELEIVDEACYLQALQMAMKVGTKHGD